jgi:putative transposase
MDPSPVARRTMGVRFDAGRRVSNASLGEALRRAGRMRGDPAYEAARRLPEQTREEQKLRAKAFILLRDRYAFSRSAIMSYASSLRVGWVREHVFAQEAQVLGARAFDAVNRWVLGLGGKPRFKNASRGLHSMQCKDGLGALRPVLAPDGPWPGSSGQRAVHPRACDAAGRAPPDHQARVRA